MDLLGICPELLAIVFIALIEIELLLSPADAHHRVQW